MADDIKYTYQAVKTIRGREANKIAEMEAHGWELVDQTRGTVQTTLKFRRVMPETFTSKAWAAFRRLDAKTQLRLTGVIAGLVAIVALVGGIAVALGDGNEKTEEAAAKPTQQAAASESPSESAAPTASPSPSNSPSPTMSPSEAYTYAGPDYEIVTMDEDVNGAHLNQYWVYAEKFDYSNDAFRDQVKAIVTDIVRRERTPNLVVQVVTDKEIIEAESNATIATFMQEHGPDYFRDVIAPKEATDWVAWYRGGFDPDTAEASDDDAAYRIDWIAEAIQGSEQWKPDA